MMSGGSPTDYIPKPMAEMTLQMMSPKRSVIIDMVMVQLISAILLGLGILFFRGNDLTASETSSYMIGVFVSFLLLTSIYGRITR
ncbi:MAG: hypothetical protein CMF55_00185 [Legionellales bacterium]|jgi:hypothetical protein|nr:hypothetical protein [Legionellales bacterium]|tara:strand:- start:4882 stop:5136 length:255 start_codon:yes stop_codon:yes gene_type:complete